MGDGIRLGIGLEKTKTICQRDMGKGRTIESMWVCDAALRNVCRSKAIVTKIEWDCNAIEKSSLNLHHQVHTT